MELRFITSSRQAVMNNSSKKISIGDIGQCRLHLKIFHAKLIEEHLQVDIDTIAVLHVGWMNEVIYDMALHASEAAAAVCTLALSTEQAQPLAGMMPSTGGPHGNGWSTDVTSRWIHCSPMGSWNFSI